MRAGNVCCVFDKNFMCQGMVLLRSLIDCHPARHMDIYALVLDMDEDEKCRVSGLSQKDVQVHVVDVSGYVENFKDIDSMGWNYATYIRLLLEDILPGSVDKVLYIDSDTIVTGPVWKALGMDIGDDLVAAVLDKYISRNEKAKLGLSDTEPYFNAGVLLINVKQWREEHVGEQCIRYLEENADANNMPDQNALNVILKGRCRLLPLSYNVDGYHLLLPYRYAKHIIRQPIDKYYEQAGKLYAHARKRPVIVHFTGWYLDKPWIRGNLQPYAAEFERYAAKAGIPVPWKERQGYTGLLTGQIRNRTRDKIGRAIRAGDLRTVVRVYQIADWLLSAGSGIKNIFRVLTRSISCRLLFGGGHDG